MAKANTQVTLTPNTIHCVKTGIALVTLVGDGKTVGIDTLNALLTSGKFEAGNHPGHIKLSKAEMSIVEDRCGAKLPRHRWAAYNRTTNEWTQYAGWTIGQHNEAVLESFGFNADPSTLSKGQAYRRQYGVFDKPEPKAAKQSKADVAASIVYGSEGTVPEIVSVLAEPVTVVPPGMNAMDVIQAGLAPTKGELTAGKGSYVKYKKRAMAMGATSKQATELWNAGRKGAQPTAPVSTAKPTASEAPKPTAPKAPIVAASGSTIRVTPEALRDTLAALQGATIGGFDGEAFTVTY